MTTPTPQVAAPVCTVLAEEAADLATLLRRLQGSLDGAAVPDMSDELIRDAQALDRACQTLDDMGAILERIAVHEVSGSLGEPDLRAAMGAARQDHLRRRLLSRVLNVPSGPQSAQAEAGTVDLF